MTLIAASEADIWGLAIGASVGIGTGKYGIGIAGAGVLTVNVVDNTTEAGMSNSILTMFELAADQEPEDWHSSVSDRLSAVFLRIAPKRWMHQSDKDNNGDVSYHSFYRLSDYPVHRFITAAEPIEGGQ